MLGLFFVACGSPEASETEQEVNVQDTPKETEVVAIGGRSFSVPSPVQAALAIKNSGLKYQRDLTVPLDRGGSMVRKMQQAALLGMHGADMAYVTVHSDGQRALATLQAIEKLGGKLELSNAFDRSLLDRFKRNISSEDSLLRFSGTAFRAADQYLKNNERHDVSTMVLVGGWVESMHLTLADPASATNAELMQRVGEQKSTLDGMIALLTEHDKDGSNGPLLNALVELKAEYAEIDPTYTYEKPVTDAANRTTYINSMTTVTVPAGKVTVIAAKVSAIRSMILA